MATIIKANSPTDSTPDVRPIAFNYDDVVGKASAYLEQVRQQAGEILTAARREAETIKEQARKQGAEAAKTDARRHLHQEVKVQLDQQLTTLRPALEAAIAQIASAKAACMRKWEEQMVQLAAAIAGRVIRRQVEAMPEIAIPLLREAMELAVGSQRIRVRMHPDDLHALNDQVAGLVKQFDQIGDAEISGDESIERGSCVVDTEFGTIDQRWETQLKRIEEELT